MKKKSTFRVILLILITAVFVSCFDTTPPPTTDEYGNSFELNFASGPEYGNYYPFAEGFIDSLANTTGIFLTNRATAGTLENAGMLVSGRAYMGMVQEDLFKYSKDKFKKQYDTDPKTAQKIYLQIASQINVLMALYKEDVFLLVKNDINDIAGLAGKIVNVGPEGSGTLITASNVLDAHKEINSIDCTRINISISDAVSKIAAGSAECDATFWVSSSPNALLKGLASDAPVKLIRVYMPDSRRTYDENGTIASSDYAFQAEDVTRNITVKSLLAVGPQFSSRSVGLFLNDVFSKAKEYENFSSKWKDVNRAVSFDYIRKNPQLVNYSAFCAIAAAPEINAFNVNPDFYTAEYGSSYSEIATELIWLMSHNIGVDLKPRNSTGSRENAIRLADGKAAVTIVQDDLYSSLEKNSLIMDSLQVATMKKIMPLHYEYLHLLVNTSSGISSISNFPGKEINLGPKTSGTFLTAMALVKSYGFKDTDNVYYSFDSPGDAVLKLNSSSKPTLNLTDNYLDATFVMSGLPYYRFYSKDTWSVATNLLYCNLIGCAFKNNVKPFPYDTDGSGKLYGAGSVQNYYPYPSYALSSTSINTVKVRAVMVASPVFDDSKIATFIKSVFRKSYYMTNPPDPDLWPTAGYGGDFQPQQMWVPIRKESIKSVTDLDDYNTSITVLTQRGVYDTIIGAKEYFVNNPYGWSKKSAEYYLTMFPDN